MSSEQQLEEDHLNYCLSIIKQNIHSLEEKESEYKETLTLQRLKHVGFLCTFTSKYTRKYIRLMSFHKTFITKDTFVSINDNIRLVSKPFYIFSFKSQYYLNFYYLLIFLFPYYVVYRNYQIFHYIY